MKKTVPLSLLLSPLFFLSSGQKELANPDGEYYIEAKINGAKKVFEVYPIAVFEDEGHISDIVGYTTTY